MLRLPQPIQVTSAFPPGTYIDLCKPVTVTWSGGDPASLVSVRLISHFEKGYTPKPGDLETAFTCAAPATGGRIDLPLYPGGCEGSGFVPVNYGNNGEIIVTVSPDPAAEAPVSAAGLTKGVKVSWKYEYRFGGLSVFPSK